MYKLPYEDISKINLDFSAEALDNLDKQAEKAEKNLIRIQNAQKKAGGIFAGGKTDNVPRSTRNQYEESLLERDSSATGPAVKTRERFTGLLGETGAPIKRKTLGDEVKEQKGILQKMMSGELGDSKAGEAVDFLKNPYGKVLQFLQTEVPIIGGLIQIEQLAEKVMQELEKKGGLLDQFFKDTIANLTDALRQKTVQASIRSGFTQLIIVTKSGSTNPRDTYNTFSQYQKDKNNLEDIFSVRNNRGY